ncbi:MAG TPA: hypothetical protein VFI54_11455 [Solirubrobacteraceae bacterium]|nr:hypothetical protein [Solirubrobacteraceae bacterium]
MEAHPVDGVARLRAQTRAAALWQRLRQRAMTTPGKLALVSTLVVAGALCFGVVATLAARSRADAAKAARTQTEPLLVQAVTLYGSLSDANATATTTFLTGGLEPPQRRSHYLRDLRLATGSLTTLTGEVSGSSEARVAVRTIGDQLPVYSGLVESARANNLQGFPVGAAYLRRASTLLTGKILPAANRLYTIEATRLGDDYRRGTSNGPLLAVAIAIALSLVTLIAAQIYVARVSRRILNVWMLLATLVILGVSVWAVVGLVGERNALIRAQRNGSDSVEVLTASRVLLSRAQSDQSLTLVSRGSDAISPADFDNVMTVLSPRGGMIGEVAPLAARAGRGQDAQRLAQEFADYRAQASRVIQVQKSGRIPEAIHLAVADAASPSSPAARLSFDLAAQTNAAQARFESQASDAASALSGLDIAIPALAVAAAILALVGLRHRASEYR